MGENKKAMDKNLLAWYPFDDAKEIGKDISGNGNTATPMGKNVPKVEKINGLLHMPHFEINEY